MRYTSDNPEITRLIEQAIAMFGSEAKLGRVAGYTQNSIWYAKVRGRCSRDMALAIDRVTGGDVSKEALRPDLFMEAAE